jgi:hypothetical protein
VNLVIDAPARAWRSWQPDGRALHDAAERYLELAPDGDHAAEATGWLDTLGAQERASARVSPFQDGILVLPHARTRFARLSSTRIVVARAALEAEALDLLEMLGVGDAPALLLALDSEPGRAALSGDALPSSASLEVLERLASGIERATLSPRASSASALLESLRRLDQRVREGRALIAQPWTLAAAAGLDAVGAALVDGGRTRTVGDVEVARHREALLAERDLGGSGAFCPRETQCIDVRRDVNQALFARTDADGEAGIGARAGFDDAQLAVEVGTSGPRLSLVIAGRALARHRRFARGGGCGRPRRPPPARASTSTRPSFPTRLFDSSLGFASLRAPLRGACGPAARAVSRPAVSRLSAP